MIITIKRVVGEPLPLKVEPFMTIHQVKQFIENGWGRPITDQVLIFNKQELKDDYKCSDYHILHQSLLYLFNRSHSTTQDMMQTFIGDCTDEINHCTDPKMIDVYKRTRDMIEQTLFAYRTK